jgi:hypothetical protein
MFVNARGKKKYVVFAENKSEKTVTAKIKSGRPRRAFGGRSGHGKQRLERREGGP